MNIDPKKIFTQQEQQELYRMLRYIDFRCSQPPSATSVDEVNIDATTIAALLLSGWAYNETQLRNMIVDNDNTAQDALWVRRYRTIVSDILSGNIGNDIDEMSIISLHTRLYGRGRIDKHHRNTLHLLYNANAVQPSLSTAPASSIVIHPELSRLVEWLLVRCQGESLHPLIISAAFIYEFVSCHTLDVGKDEISHLLTLLLLQRHNAHWIVTSTPCRVMANDPLTYHRTLKGRENIGNDISRWIIYWIKQVYEAAQQAAQTHAPILPDAAAGRKTCVNNRQRRILDFIEKNQPVKLAAITTHLHKESINTIKKDLIHLRQLGYITAEGVLKGTVYYRH